VDGKVKKKSCWGCKSSQVIKWGKQNNKQRFKCKSCGLLFTRINNSVRENNQFIWFKKWVLHRQTLAYLSKESGYGLRTLKRYFHNYLSKAPSLPLYPKERLNLLIDGTYFSNDICLIVYRDNTIKFTQLYRFTGGEYFHEIKEDLDNLLKLNISIESITCDGHKAILKAIKLSCKEVILQRCIVHIERECKIWLTTNPKSQAGYELLFIVRKLSLIKTHYQSHEWIMELYNWHQRHKDYINEKSYSFDTKRYWFKHKMVRKAFIHIKNALPNMFQYLFNDRIPKSTNGLESFFGHLKSHLLLHRGLTKEHRKNFIKWYLYFKNCV
jgi:hypothetical protein